MLSLFEVVPLARSLPTTPLSRARAPHPTPTRPIPAQLLDARLPGLPRAGQGPIYAGRRLDQHRTRADDADRHGPWRALQPSPHLRRHPRLQCAHTLWVVVVVGWCAPCPPPPKPLRVFSPPPPTHPPTPCFPKPHTCTFSYAQGPVYIIADVPVDTQGRVEEMASTHTVHPPSPPSFRVP